MTGGKWGCRRPGVAAVDAMVQQAYAGDAEKLAKWRVAKRVHLAGDKALAETHAMPQR